MDLDKVVSFLHEQPLLLLFLIAAVGYPLGRIKIAGVSLGVAMLLFVGLAFGAVDSRLQLPEVFFRFGLALFVFTIGLSSAPGFFGAMNKRGLRNNFLTLVAIGTCIFAVAFAVKLFHLRATIGAGLFAGIMTNTPTLAAVVDAAKRAGDDPSLPTVGYAIAYPFGVICPMLAILLVKKIERIDYREEAKKLPASLTGLRKVDTWTINVTNPEAESLTKRAVFEKFGCEVAFGRLQRQGVVLVPSAETGLRVGDRLTVVGSEEDLEKIEDVLGVRVGEDLSRDREEIDYRRMFVSNPEVVGRPLRNLHLQEEFEAVVTRIRRGDVEFVPNGDSVLELGDRVRITTRRDNLARVAKFMGDSYRSLSEVDLLNFSLGLAIGIGVGEIPVHLPGNMTIKLGIAGGPLVVALILGKLQRTGPMVWSMPYSANLTLRQLGLMLFAAGIGTRAGQDFGKTIAGGTALPLLASAAAITFFASLIMLLVGRKVFKLSLSTLSGILSGAQTQPVLLGFANEQTKNDLPNVGYATVYPVAMIAKIIFAQLLFEALR